MTHTTGAPEAGIAALSRWDNEGGAAPLRKSSLKGANGGASGLDDSELNHLRMRVIALENAMVALLSQASVPALVHVCSLSNTMRPRANRTQHRLTVQAADHMLQLLDRAAHLDAVVD